MPLPLVAIVGAPNVGKSTLFNRLVRRRRAIVTDEPGVTRDRLYGEVRGVTQPFRLVDTGGLTPGMDAPFAHEIGQQAEAALVEASLILFVVDARAGATALEQELADALRRRRQPVVLVANKVDSERSESLAGDLYRLGLGDPVTISAEHGRGIAELLERIASHLHSGDTASADDRPEPASEPEAIRVAIVGRPNVGKSSLLNRLVGEERAVVSEIAGTTRDSVDTRVEVDGRTFVLIDTAGIRRPGRVGRGAERFSVAHARRSIERCDVVLLVLDASQPLAAQDAHIAGFVRQAYRPMLVVVNKWDLVEGREDAARRWMEQIRYRLRFVKEVPIAWVSARTGQRVSTLLGRLAEMYDAAARWLSTSEINRWLEGSRGAPGDTSEVKQPFRMFYVTQTGIRPPSFLVFCNDPAALHFSRRRQLENSLREHFDFGPLPLKLQFRRRPRRGRP